MTIKPTAVITGGLGFIGSNLAKHLLDLGMCVIIFDNLDPNSGGNLNNISSFRDKVTLVIGDITNYNQLLDVLINADYIFHCAAASSHPLSMREPSNNLEVNSRGVINLLEALRKTRSTARLVHLATTTQLGSLLYTPADENHPEFPLDIYSANKMAAEKFVLIYAKAYGIKATVIRLPNIYGPRASIHSPEFTFNNYFIGLALQNKPLTVYKPGLQKRNLLYVDDAVQALIAAAFSDNSIGQVFIAASSDHFSVKEIADLICEVIGGSVNFIEWPHNRKITEFGDAIFSHSKITEILGWRPVIALKDGLELTKQFYLDKLACYI